MKNLLISDDADAASYVTDELREHGHAVEHVDDGSVSLSLAVDKRYEFLIVDHALPAMDGLSMVRTIHDTASRTIVSVGALDGLDDRETGFNVGGNDYFMKLFATGAGRLRESPRSWASAGCGSRVASQRDRAGSADRLAVVRIPPAGVPRAQDRPGGDADHTVRANLGFPI